MVEFKYLGTIITNRNEMHKEIKYLLNSGNALRGLLSSQFLSKNIKLKIYHISSHYLSVTSPYRYFYVTHAARALQSHNLSGEGIKQWTTYILFDHTRTWRASPDE